MQSKENFCPACLAIPLAFTGAAGATAGAVMSEEDKRRKRRNSIIFWSGSILFTIAGIVWWKYKSCKTCKNPYKR